MPDTDALPERLHVLSKYDSGDWLCWANDGTTLWRFQRYEDGAVNGLDVDYDFRTFWRALYLPAARDLPINTIDGYPWREAAQWLPSRQAAIDVMLRAGVA